MIKGEVHGCSCDHGGPCKSHINAVLFFTNFYKLSVTCYKTFLLYLITILILLALHPSIASPLPNLYVSGVNWRVLMASSRVLWFSCCSHAAMAMILSCLKFLSCIIQFSIFFFSSPNLCSCFQPSFVFCKVFLLYDQLLWLPSCLCQCGS